MSAEPVELIAKTTGKVVGFVCGQCSCTTTMMFPSTYLGSDEERLDGARQAAETHCGPWFCECGKEREQHWKDCRACRDAVHADELATKERAAFDAAKKVSAAEWSGDYVWSDRFQDIFGHIGDLLDRYESNGEEPPEYVWECEPTDFVLNAGDILDSETESQEAWDGLRDGISSADEAELQALLDGWLKGRELRWWNEAHARAVLLPRPATSKALVDTSEPRPRQ